MKKTAAEVKEIVKRYFENRKEAVMVFLFGSYASDNFCAESDVDIAVYLNEDDNKAEIDIQNGIERLLGKEVDLLNLSRAKSVLAWEILRKGIPLVIKDRGIYLDFLLDISREAMDLTDFNLDAYRRKYGFRAG